MKIAIITMQCPLNYGAVLQAYALKTYLSDERHDVEVINYRPNYIVRNQSYSHVPDGPFSRNKILSLLYIIRQFLPKRRRKNLFNNFCKELNLTKKVYSTYEELEAHVPEADIYICGSDQIWGKRNGAANDPSYFLSFVNNKGMKVSYAASSDITDFSEQLIKRINGLDFVSVREAPLKEILETKLNRIVYHVADPVFLLPQDAWLNLRLKSSTIRFTEKYILIYIIGEGNTVIKNAYLLSKAKQIPIYCISASLRKDKRINKQFVCSPYEFPCLFANAEYIITNSFHGVSFSLIFSKQFWCCKTGISSTRITSLLQKVGILERYVDNINIKEPDINYDCINENLERYIRDSKEYLHLLTQKKSDF